MKKWLVPMVAAAILATGCRSYNFDAPTVEPGREAGQSDVGVWGAQAEYYFDVRDLDKAKAAIEEYVDRNDGSVVYVSQQDDQYVVQFVVAKATFDKVGGKLLENSALTYYVRADQPDAGDGAMISVTVVMNRLRIPGPLAVALWIPAKVLQTLVWLN